MAYLIQQTADAVNVLDTDKAIGEQIILVFSVINTIPLIVGDKIRISNNEKRQDFTTFIDGLLVQEIGGSPTLWTGTNDELLELISSFFETAGGGTGAGTASIDKQDEQLTQATNYQGKKSIGKIIDLENTATGSWAGYPLDFVNSPLIAIVITTATTNNVLTTSLGAQNATELVSILNKSQVYYFFSVIDDTHLLVNDGTLSVSQLNAIAFSTSNFGDMSWDSFTDSADVPLSNTDVINENIKTMRALSKAASDTLEAINTALANGTQKTQLYQEGANVGKNNGAWMKFSNDSITKSASGALLVNTPTILFDGKTLNADDTNFLWQSVGTGTGTWANNMFSMSVTSGQYYIRQSRRFMPYFSGYPVLAELTFDNFNIEANGTKRLGYFSSSAVAPHTAALDGFWLEMDGTTYRMVSYNNGTETSNIPFSSFTNYATLSTYNFDNFTACMFSFLWLGGAQLALWLCTAADGWILANLTPYVGNNKGTICRSPNQAIRYELRSSTGTLDFRQVCCQVSVGGNPEKLGFSLPSLNTAAIACNAIGTLYALQGFKKNATNRDIAVKLESMGCINAATTDSGVLMIIRNPTLSAPLTYAAYGKIDRAIATTQTLTIGTGDMIAVTTVSSSGESNTNLSDNYKAWLTQTITNTFDEYVLCYLAASANQDVRGYAVLKEY